MEFNINGWEALVIIILIISLYNIIKEIVIAITYNNVVKKLVASKMSKKECEEVWDSILPPYDLNYKYTEEVKEKPKKTRSTKKNED